MIKKVNPEHDEMVQNVLDTDGELPGGEYNAVAEALAGRRDVFLKSDKTGRALMKRQLNMWSQNIGAYKNFRQDVAAAYNTKTLMKTWSDSPYGKAIMSLLSDKPRLVEKKCPEDQHCAHKGELGVFMPNFKKSSIAQDTLSMLDEEYEKANIDVQKLYSQDYLNERKKLLNIVNSSGQEWTAISNLKSKIKLKDTGTQEALKAMGNNYINQSTQVNNNDNINFNQAAAERQVRVNIVGGAENMESLIYDDLLEGRNFYDDFVSKVSTNTYSNLGVKLKGVNENDGIDYEEAKIIANAIVQKPEYEKVLKEELVRYYTGYLENQWNMGKANRANPNNGAKVENSDGSIDYTP